VSADAPGGALCEPPAREELDASNERRGQGD
jgi:hypothetical protein